jgi:copper homeostasis protein (lipoprotein)
MPKKKVARKAPSRTTRPVQPASLLHLSAITLATLAGLLILLNFLAKKPEVTPQQLPYNATSLTTSNTTTFSGTLPCADCPGIKTSIMLHKDNTFLMKEIYLERNDEEPVITEGDWQIVKNPNEKEGELTYQLTSGNSTQYYLLTSQNQLKLLDANMQEITAEGLNFTLTKSN